MSFLSVIGSMLAKAFLTVSAKALNQELFNLMVKHLMILALKKLQGMSRTTIGNVVITDLLKALGE